MSCVLRPRKYPVPVFNLTILPSKMIDIGTKVKLLREVFILISNSKLGPTRAKSVQTEDSPRGLEAARKIGSPGLTSGLSPEGGRKPAIIQIKKAGKCRLFVLLFLGMTQSSKLPAGPLSVFSRAARSAIFAPVHSAWSSILFALGQGT